MGDLTTITIMQIAVLGCMLYCYYLTPIEVFQLNSIKIKAFNNLKPVLWTLLTQLLLTLSWIQRQVNLDKTSYVNKAFPKNYRGGRLIIEHFKALHSASALHTHARRYSMLIIASL
jgi:hypothetical protein